MKKTFFQSFPKADFAITMICATIFCGIIAISNLWVAKFQPVTTIHLSLWFLPYYALLSTTRAAIAYFLSFIFTIIVGYMAAHSQKGEKFLIPLLDILQSIPVFGFLPGILLSLVGLFPHSNLGLELSAIVFIFTSQVWNMTFCFYECIKSIPNDLTENTQILNLSWFNKLIHLELPFSAIPLAWNSVLSVAGGWFFLMPIESFTLGSREFRLPGLGSYLDSALKASQYFQAGMALLTMAILIFILDFIIWRPILVWAQKFSLHDIQEKSNVHNTIMSIWIRDSQLIKSLARLYHNFFFRPVAKVLSQIHFSNTQHKPSFLYAFFVISLKLCSLFLCLFLIKNAFLPLKNCFQNISFATWSTLLSHGVLSMLRIFFCLIMATLIYAPFSVWLGIKPSRIRHVQPILQLLVSFPGSMLYTLILLTMNAIGIPFHVTCILLIFIGIQWYVFFNALSGVSKISPDLHAVLTLTGASQWTLWKDLYFPSIYPSLLTGWITATGAGWNALVIAEFLEFNHHTFNSKGLGSDIRHALEKNDSTFFLASLLTMIFFILCTNRFFWAPLYKFVLKRYQYD